MVDADARPSGFMIAVVVFWFLAAGLAGTVFVYFQKVEQSRRHAALMKEDITRLKKEAEATLGDLNKLRAALDYQDSDDARVTATVKSHLAHLDGKGAWPNVAAALTGTRALEVDLTAAIDALQTDKASLERQLARAKQEKDASEETWQKQLAALDARIAASTSAINARVNELNTKLTDLTRQIDAGDQQMRRERDTMLGERIRFDQQLRLLIGKRRELKDQLRLTLEFRPRPVGRILGANMALDFAFVNLGSRHGVVEGMRFSVYPPATVFQPGLRPKGVVEIKRVEDLRSQARVVRQNLADPIVTGDLLVNIAFDPTGYKPTFVMVRFIDIDGDNIDDRDEVITIIREQGGTVLAPDPRAVSVDTDFILIGEEWNYGDPTQRLFHERDQPVMDIAERRSITQLDVDTFLNYVGFPKWK